MVIVVDMMVNIVSVVHGQHGQHGQEVKMVNMVKIVIRLSFWLTVYKTLRSTFIE